MTTTEAARILGVHPSYVRHLSSSGKLHAERIDGQWQLDLGTVLAYRHQLNPRHGQVRRRLFPPSSVRSLQLLNEWGTAQPEELALVVDIHAGNVRKGLAIAEKLGLVTRAGSNWSLTDAGRQWLVDHAREVAA